MADPNQIRTYAAEESVSFRSTKAKFGGLSNMAGGYPLRVNGILVPSAEALYQACRFPHRPDIQRLILRQTSPMTAKMVSKPYRGDTRLDWDHIRVRVMRWVLRVKLAMHWQDFGRLLQETGDRPIVEDSRRDDFWGALRQEDGTLVGMNVLGRLLMELRGELTGSASERLRVVDPPPLPNFLLYGEPIRCIGFSAAGASQSDPDAAARPGTLWELPISAAAALAEPAEMRTAAQTTLRAATMPGKTMANDRRVGYPKRLIEVDLPIKRISAHARREKSIRHGHISTLHIWWARRPLAACRAVICAALWPDPADETCPIRFREDTARAIRGFAKAVTSSNELAKTCSAESIERWMALSKRTNDFNVGDAADLLELRRSLLDFIADFANWDNSTVKEYLETSRALTLSAHEALGGVPGTRPLVVDPFAGGGSIPLEALRVGADAFASDLNPVAVLLNKIVLEYIPEYGQRLADEVRKWGEWIKQEAEKELAEFYPKDPDGATPIAYLWARTIRCEGPSCGAEVPLIRSLWLAKKANRSVALQLVPRPRAKRVDFQIIVKQRDGWVDQDDPKTKIEAPEFEGTVRRGSATCPCCGYTTPVERIREQLKARRGGANDARLMCVVTLSTDDEVRIRTSADRDEGAATKARRELLRQEGTQRNRLSLLPDERISLNEIRRICVPLYGMTTWGDLFTSRQGLALATLARLIRTGIKEASFEEGPGLRKAAQTCLAMSLDKCADYWNSTATWMPRGTVGHGFARQAVPMTWDFVEANPLADFHCAWHEAFEWTAAVCEAEAASKSQPGHSSRQPATAQSLPDDAAQALITDPPYYDAVPYAHLSDFFYVWLRRCVGDIYPDELRDPVVAKEAEIVVDRPHGLSTSNKGVAFYESELTKAFADSRRVLQPPGIGTIVFASKTTASWEAILNAVVEAGWVITGSWPIDTEREARLAAQGQARLASSVHLVCRPRENLDGSVRIDEVGDWREVLAELPRRIHDWMPRLAEEGVVGADAIFACLGPALEIFSRYSHVEKASGEAVTLKEYLAQVWAAVAKEALTMIFTGADASGFEEDARLTAMWLWTLRTGEDGNGQSEDEEEPGDEDETTAKKTVTGGFSLEYDAARKIAQGLGAHLEELKSVVEVKGDKARLLPVSERARYLFGKTETPAVVRRARKSGQQALFADAFVEPGSAVSELRVERVGETALDRVHQSMLLFASGRTEALRRFLVEEGVGADQRFWRLAQAFSALYPASSEEKRWVDGVLAKKKGFGL